MLNTEDEKLEIATGGDDDKRKSLRQQSQDFVIKKNQK